MTLLGTARFFPVVAALLCLSACQSSGVPSGSTCPTDSVLTYETFGSAFMQTYCTDCHGGLKTLAGIRNQGLAIIDEQAAAGPDAVNVSMPQGQDEPTELERQQLGEWLACGAP